MTRLRSETGLARIAIGVIALHLVDDSFLQPNSGTSAGDHLFGGLVPLSLLIVAGILYGRVRAGARATIALLSGFFGVLAGTEAVHYTIEGGPSGDDYTGLLSLVAGLVLLGLGGVTLWRSRRLEDRRPLALRATAAPDRRRPGLRVRHPLPRLRRVRRHARRPRGRAGSRPRRSLRGRPVHDDRRLAPEGLVHPLAERGSGDLVPRPGLVPTAREAAGAARIRRPPLRPSRRRRQRRRPQPLRLARRARHPRGSDVPQGPPGCRSGADRRHRALGRRRDDDRGRRGVAGPEGDRLGGRE